MSGFWTRLAVEVVLEAEQIARGFAPVRAFVMPTSATNEASRFQLLEMNVEGRSRNLDIGRQLVLREKTAEVRVVPVAEVKEHELGYRVEPALLDRPGGCLMAHGIRPAGTLTVALTLTTPP